MIRNLRLEVRDKKQFEAIKRAMQDDEIVTFVELVGILKPFKKPTQRLILETAAKMHDLNDGLKDHER